MDTGNKKPGFNRFDSIRRLIIDGFVEMMVIGNRKPYAPGTPWTFIDPWAGELQWPIHRDASIC